MRNLIAALALALAAGLVPARAFENPLKNPAYRGGGDVPEPAVRGPVLGLVFDPAAGSLRPIYGIPGAATIGAPLEIGMPLARAAVSPAQDAVLGIGREDAGVVLVRVRPGAVSARAVAEVPPAPDRIAFSPKGAAAALYYAATGRVRVIRGLPEEARPAAEFDLSLFPGAVTAMAVSDDGGAVLAGLADNGAGSVVVADENTGPRLLYPVQHASALSFVPGTRDALLADDAENEIYFVRDASGLAAVTPVARAEDGVAGPVAVQASEDGRRAFVANSRSGSITALDLAGGGAETLRCNCAPAGLERLNGSVFRLTEPSRDALWLLDGETRGLFFVPPAPAAADAKAGAQ